MASLGTFSIAGRCARIGMLGVAVASRFLAVGALCPHAGAGVQALAAGQAAGGDKRDKQADAPVGTTADAHAVAQLQRRLRGTDSDPGQAVRGHGSGRDPGRAQPQSPARSYRSRCCFGPSQRAPSRRQASASSSRPRPPGSVRTRSSYAAVRPQAATCSV